MAGRWVVAFGTVLLLTSGAARAQFTAAADPCAPTYRTGIPLMDLANAMGEQHRRDRCIAERQAQWAEYNARQKAIKDAADSHAAEQRTQQAAASAQTGHEQAASRKTTLAADTRTRPKRAAPRPVSEHVDRQAQEKRRLRGAELVRAENAPDNTCHDPKLARAVMDGWNGLDTMKEAGVKVIDIEHVTTVYFHAGNESFKCHGVFVTNRGWKVIGTTEVKKNIAGDGMFVWQRDTDQDFALYDAPVEPGPSETARQARVGEPPATVTQVTSLSAASAP